MRKNRIRVLAGDKVLVEVTGKTVPEGVPFKGYEMHVGRTTTTARPLLALDRGGTDGAIDSSGRVIGCYIHGLLADDRQRQAEATRVFKTRTLPLGLLGLGTAGLLGGLLGGAVGRPPAWEAAGPGRHASTAQAASIVPSRRWTCQSSGRRMVIEAGFVEGGVGCAVAMTRFLRLLPDGLQC
jgi:hypothetical protein